MQLTGSGEGDSRPQLGHCLLPKPGGIIHIYSGK
jgi:hypothetical protein